MRVKIFVNKKRKGYKILRFWNDSVFLETENVLEAILVSLGLE
ncbi:MAG: DUF559 domain-containing protein [Gammaproteobacteria bacterium]